MSDSESTSVFTDDSGSRRRWVVWAVRGASASLAAAAVTALVSVVGHVTLPGLDAPLHVPGSGSRSDPTATGPDETARTPTSEPPAATSTTPDPATRASTAERSGDSGGARAGRSGDTGRPDRVTPTAPSVTTPAPAATTPPAVVTKPRGKPTAKPPTAADPEHSPGNPPTEPPGKAKKSTGSS